MYAQDTPGMTCKEDIVVSQYTVSPSVKVKWMHNTSCMSYGMCKPLFSPSLGPSLGQPEQQLWQLRIAVHDAVVKISSPW